MLMHLRTVAIGLLLLAGFAGALAGERGFFGLSLAVELEVSTANPTLREVKVVKVLTASPAAEAGIQRGDLIVEVEGRPIAGASAVEMQAMQRDVGQPLRLSVQRGKAAPFPVTLIAVVARPE
jgi:C-terminal processing protease CtpA/Prc